MAEEKKSAEEKSGPPSGLWFTKTFTEGTEAEPEKSKKRAIERYYEGFLRGYNRGRPPGSQHFEITKFNWTEDPPKVHRLDVYITPPPLVVPPATTDPPNPSHPPPKMTFDVGTDPDTAEDISSNA